MSKILIIDDDNQNREIVKIRLQQAGHAVVEAPNGEEGLAAAQQNPPDAIVLDVMMPKMDGWQVCQSLKADFRTKNIPIIMLTARSEQIEELRGWESGANEYLTKPCDYQVLLATINDLLSQNNKEKNDESIPILGHNTGVVQNSPRNSRPYPL